MHDAIEIISGCLEEKVIAKGQGRLKLRACFFLHFQRPKKGPLFLPFFRFYGQGPPGPASKPASSLSLCQYVSPPRRGLGEALASPASVRKMEYLKAFKC